MTISKFLAVFMTCVFLLTALPAHAQELKKVNKPEWEICGDKACLSLTGAKDLAILWVEYTHLFDTRLEMEQSLALWNAAYEDATAANSHLKTAVAAEREAHEGTIKRLEVCDEAKSSTDFPALAFSVGAGIGVVAGAVFAWFLLVP